MNRLFYTTPVEDLQIYIMGPVTGLKDNNLPAFRAMERMVKEVCPTCTVIVPHDLDAKIDYSLKAIMTDDEWSEYVWQQYMKVCIPEVIKSHLVISLNGWEESRGSKIEKMNADVLGIGVRLPSMALVLLGEVYKASGAVAINN